MPFGDRWTPSTRYRPVLVPHLMLSCVSEVPPRSEMMFWILRFTVVRTRSTSWLSLEWRHTLRGRMLDHTRKHRGKMLLMEVRSFLTAASRLVGLSVLRSLPPRCRMRTSGLGQVIFSWWSWGSSCGHVMPWVPFHQIVTLLGSMPSCIPTSGDLARDSAQYTREWPQIQTFLGSLFSGLPKKCQQNVFVSPRTQDSFPLGTLTEHRASGWFHRGRSELLSDLLKALGDGRMSTKVRRPCVINLTPRDPCETSRTSRQALRLTDKYVQNVPS